MNPARPLWGHVSFLLAIGAFATLLYAYLYLRDFDADTAFAYDFHLFHDIGQKLRWPLPEVDAFYDLRPRQNWLSRTTAQHIPYLYLPHFLPLLAPLEGRDFLISYAAWMGVILLVYGWVMAKLPPWSLTLENEMLKTQSGYGFGPLILCCALPHLAHLIVAGHPSAVVAMLVYAGFQQRENRPLLSGLLFALATYKPQMTVMVPVLLLAGRHWRAWWSFCGFICLLAAFDTALFGWAFWPRYMAMLQQHGEIMLQMPAEVLNQTMGVFPALRMLGANHGMAWAMQGLSTFGIMGLMAYASYHRAALATLVLLVAGPFLASPYIMLYDSIMLAPAIAALITAETCQATSLSRRMTVLLLLLLPFTALMFQPLHVPMGCITLLLLAAQIPRLLWPVMPESHAVLTEN